jgi:hypothetical protein
VENRRLSIARIDCDYFEWSQGAVLYPKMIVFAANRIFDNLGGFVQLSDSSLLLF